MLDAPAWRCRISLSLSLSSLLSGSRRSVLTGRPGFPVGGKGRGGRGAGPFRARLRRFVFSPVWGWGGRGLAVSGVTRVALPFVGWRSLVLAGACVPWAGFVDWGFRVCAPGEGMC
jgi:hypothetical protein